MAAAIIDLYPVHLQRYREVVVLAVCLVMFILGLSCVTQVRRTQNTSVSQGILLRSPFCSRHCRGTRHVCENLHSYDVTIQRSFRRLWLVVILTEPIRHLQEPLIRKPLRHEQCKPTSFPGSSLFLKTMGTRLQTNQQKTRHFSARSGYKQKP